MSTEPLRAFPKTKISKKEFKFKLNFMGFNVRFKTVSFEDLWRKSKIFPIVTDAHGEKMPTGVLSPEQFDKWGAVISFCNNHTII